MSKEFFNFYKTKKCKKNLSLCFQDIIIPLSMISIRFICSQGNSHKINVKKNAKYSILMKTILKKLNTFQNAQENQVVAPITKNYIPSEETV